MARGSSPAGDTGSNDSNLFTGCRNSPDTTPRADTAVTTRLKTNIGARLPASAGALSPETATTAGTEADLVNIALDSTRGCPQADRSAPLRPRRPAQVTLGR